MTETPPTDPQAPTTPMQLIGQSHKIMAYVKKLTQQIERSDDAKDLQANFRKYQQLSKGIIPSRNALHVTLTPFHDNLVAHLKGIYATLLMDTEQRVPAASLVRMDGGLCGSPQGTFGGGEMPDSSEIDDPFDFHLNFAGSDRPCQSRCGAGQRPCSGRCGTARRA